MSVIKVLVIEDEAEIREEVVDWLTFEGFEVYAAANGRAGTDLATSVIPDLIICDIAMPQMTGHEVLLEVRSHPSLMDAIFIFLTALAGRTSQRKSMELGADDYITKPFTHAELMNAIHTQLTKRERQNHELQNQLEVMQTSLENERQQRLLRSRLVGMFSHDFRTPLSLIMMSASLIRNYEDRLSVEKKQEKFDQIINSSEQVVQMLDDMLFAVEIGSEQFRYRAEKLDMASHVGRIVTDFQEMHQDTHTISFASNLDQSVQLDPKLLRQIATNLLSNAVKYSKRDTTVWVTLVKHDDSIEFSVKDEGVGISIEDQGKRCGFWGSGSSKANS